MSMSLHGGDIYRNQNVIDFSANINPLGTPESVKKAAKDAVDLISNYPDIQCEKLRLSIAVKERVSESHVICGNGAADIIFNLVTAIKPKKALLLAPTFAEYEQALKTVDCQIDYYFLDESQGYNITEDFISVVSNGYDMIFVCNPNNPTGTICTKSFLYRILRECKKGNTLLVIDECFNDFIDEPDLFTMKEYIEDYKNLFLVKAFTKLYAMAGLRLGYGLVSNRSVIEKMRTSTQPWNVSIPAQYAGIAALKEVEYVGKTREMIQRERNYLSEELNNLGFSIYGSKANYIFFKAGIELYDKLLRKQILIRDCGNYKGLPTSRTCFYYRVAIKVHEENAELIRKLKDI